MASDLAQALVSFISSANTLLGSRVYPMRLEDGVTLPAAVYQFVGGDPDLTHTGPGPRRVDIQLTCWAQTYGQIRTLAGQLYNLFHGYRGMGAYPVQAVYLAGEPIDVQDPEAGIIGHLYTLNVWL